MSDRDIIDTIARAMRRRVRYPTDEAAQHNAVAVLAALREQYAIIPKDELKLEIEESAMPDSTSHRYVTSWKEGRP